MNPEKLAKLQANVRIGGKGTARRKKKIVHKASNTDDKKLQSQLKKLSINPIPGIEEVNMFRDDGSVIHFTNPKVQASPQANTFAISGQAETKQVSEMLPSIVNQLGPEGFASLRKLAMEKVGEETAARGAAVVKDDDVPDLEGDFEEVAKVEEQASKVEATPEVVEATPEVVVATPEVVEATPEVVVATPEVVVATPEVVEATPEVVVATPEVVEATPEVVVATPEVVEEIVEVVTPEVPEVVPVVQEVEATPEVVESPVVQEVETAPVEPEVVQEVVAPEVPEVVPVVQEIEATPEVVESPVVQEVETAPVVSEVVQEDLSFNIEEYTEEEKVIIKKNLTTSFKHFLHMPIDKNDQSEWAVFVRRFLAMGVGETVDNRHARKKIRKLRKTFPKVEATPAATEAAE